MPPAMQPAPIEAHSPAKRGYSIARPNRSLLDNLELRPSADQSNRPPIAPKLPALLLLVLQQLLARPSIAP